VSTQERERRPERGSARDNSRLLAVAILAGLGGVFAVLNLDEVGVNWIFGEWETPLILVIGVSLLLGFALGALLASRRAKR
jgi:uncharacterized integral membrane protein